MSHYAVGRSDSNIDKERTSIYSMGSDFTFSEADESFTISDTPNLFKTYSQNFINGQAKDPMMQVTQFDYNHVKNNQICHGYNPHTNYYGQTPVQFQAKKNTILNLQQFKTIECGIKTYHDHKQCPYFHTLKDRRRNTKFYDYIPEMCPDTSKDKLTCVYSDNCNFCHNTVEQFYHPLRYKTKLCTNFPDSIDDCVYDKFCSFAHKETELRIKLLHKMEKEDVFYMYEYKTVYCPFNNQHDKSSCEYAHNVQDFRRNPMTNDYKPEICKKWNISSEITTYAQGGCLKNDICEKCHGWKEFEYHPKFYKTRQCTSGKNCSRPDCGYYHSNKDKRVSSRGNKKALDSNKSSTNKSINSIKNPQSSGSNKNIDANNCRRSDQEYNEFEDKCYISKLFSKNSDKFLKESTKSNSKHSRNFNIGFTPSNQENYYENKGQSAKNIAQSELSKNDFACYNTNTHTLSMTKGTNNTKNALDFTLMKAPRKNSETISCSSNLNIFCLRSDEVNQSNSFKFNQFISPVKLLKEFGPPDDAPVNEKSSKIKTCPVSPHFELEKLLVNKNKKSSLKSNILIRQELKVLLERLKISNYESITEMSDYYIKNLECQSPNDKKNLIKWRDELIDDLKEDDIFELIDEFNSGVQFKKSLTNGLKDDQDKILIEQAPKTTTITKSAKRLQYYSKKILLQTISQLQ